MSTASARYLTRLADMGCILCWHLGYGKTPAEIHHPREWAGAAQRTSDYLGLPLCPEHHRGNSGVHGLGTKGFYMRYKLQEHDLLAMTIERLNR